MYPQRPLSYAPTPYSYTPTSSFSATINLDEEVKLSTTTVERDLHESLAEIYSIIVTLDALEKAYLKDSIKDVDYTETCSRLLKQYKSNLVDETVSKAFKEIESFKREWSVWFNLSSHDGVTLTCKYRSNVQELLNEFVLVFQLQLSNPRPSLPKATRPRRW